jgi:hypothetical protein
LAAEAAGPAQTPSNEDRRAAYDRKHDLRTAHPRNNFQRAFDNSCPSDTIKASVLEAWQQVGETEIELQAGLPGYAFRGADRFSAIRGIFWTRGAA